MTQQLQDAPELLEQMIQDQISAPLIYHASACWEREANFTIQFLRENGLHDLRSKTGCLPLQGFGATDPPPMYYAIDVINKTADLSPDLVNAFSSLLNRWQQIPQYPGLPFGISLLDLCESAFRLTSLYGRVNGATPLENLEISMAGTPAYAFSVWGKNYTEIFLRYYMRYAYCCQFIDFNKVDTIIEIGAGAGKFAEVLKKAHPHLSFYLLEISPQSYICHQYLKGVFGDDAILNYSDLRDSKNIEVPQGKFAVLGNWQVEHIKPQGRVLFVNTASFQEMEPNIVENYLKFVIPHAQAMYLLQSTTGIPKKINENDYGAVEPVVMAHYKAFLEDKFEMISQEIAYDPLKAISDVTGSYRNMIWVNRKSCELLKS
ncbi:MAG: putative sugar O-methyltransferase [Methylophilales bacterium]|nr:putative sugar O-methyltransferase [Methylophilales bacterium]